MAEAQSNAQICRQLSSQLSSLSGGRAVGGNPRKYRQYENAIRKQGNQINRAKRALRRNGCVGALLRTHSTCRSINNSLNRMRDNLATLKTERLQFAPRQANNSGKRRRILAAMDQNRCIGNGATQARVEQQPTSRRRTLLEQVFGIRTYNDRGSRAYGETGIDDALAGRYGTFRTLCVRKSDGYYFPISFSTLPERFDVDEETCRSMCPSADVALYHHRMPSEDSEDMISYRTQIPYAQEPFAFAYRKNHNAENRCRFSTAGVTQSVDAAATGETEDAREKIRIGVPNFRIDPTLAPDTYDNAVTGFTEQKALAYLDAVESEETSDGQQIVSGNRTVRIVGPAFFPVQ